MPSSPALLPEGEGSTWPVGSGFIETGGRPDGTRWRPGAWRHKLAAGSRIPFHFVRATGFWVRVWLMVALIPGPSPGGRREHLAGGFRFYRDRWWSGWNAVESGGVASQHYGDPGFRFTPSGLRVLGPRLARGRPHRQPFSRREKGVLGRWAQVLSRPVVVRMERGGIRGRGVNNLTGIPDSVSLRPGYGLRVLGPCLALGRRHPQPFSRGRREHLAGGLRFCRGRWWPGWNAVEAGSVASQHYGDPGFRFTPSGLRALDPCLARGGPHPRPFSRREKGVLGRWAQVLSRPVVARMERGGGRGRGVTSLRGIPDSVSLHPGYGSCGFWVRVWPVVALIPSPSPAREGRTWMRIGSAHGCAHPGHGRDTFILTGFLLFPRFRAPWAVSSAVEHCLHTAGVTGSIPVPPTKIIRCF